MQNPRFLRIQEDYDSERALGHPARALVNVALQPATVTEAAPKRAPISTIHRAAEGGFTSTNCVEFRPATDLFNAITRRRFSLSAFRLEHIA